MRYHQGVDSIANRPFYANELVDRVDEARRRIAGALPDIDPADLLLILQSLLRPPGSGRRFLLRQLRSGVYVP